MKEWSTDICILILFSIIAILPGLGAVPSAEEPARSADEIIYRRPPFTFDCDFCHASGTAVNVSIPHSRTLEYHDNLVLENQTGCFICHDFFQRDRLRLLSGEMVPFEESPRLCYQCHQKRYDTWLFGDHGKSKPDLYLGTDILGQNISVEELENRRVRCSDFICHDPHNPRLFKVSLGKGYPLPAPLDPPGPARFFAPSNNEPYYDAVISTGRMFIAVAVLVLLISVLMILIRKWKI